MLATCSENGSLILGRHDDRPGLMSSSSCPRPLSTPNPQSGQLPDYITSATPNPPDKRAPWYKTTAQTYAGIFLWFVFWDSMSGNGLSTGGLGATLLGIVIGAVICHFCFYLIPGLLGMRTGLPLYVVGT